MYIASNNMPYMGKESIMSQTTYCELVEEFAGIKGISKNEAARIILKVVKDYQKGLK